MGLWPTQGDEKLLGPATTSFYGAVPPLICHPDPDFLPRSTGYGRACAFLLKAHQVRQRHQIPQEIRGSEAEGSAVSSTPNRCPRKSKMIFVRSARESSRVMLGRCAALISCWFSF
jgi:hypothetical protein